VSYLDGKVLAVTGGASGFGLEIASQSAARGARVILLDIDAVRAAQAAATIVGAGGGAQGIGLDVCDRRAFADVVNQVVAEHGRIDILVNNAGIMPLAFLADHDRAADAWDRCIDINIKGVLHGIYAVYDHMVAQGGGHVVNVSSVYGNAGIAGAAVYGATKAAIGTLSNALRVEAQGRIKVTVVRPSGMAGTNLSSSVIDFAAAAPLAAHRVAQWQEHIAQLTAGSPSPGLTDRDDPRCWTLQSSDAAAQVVHAIDQPQGFTISEITLRASGEDYVY
jgi:NADP-dependent 3-hydroxy acid dehydrogenase YdfG